MSDKHFITGNHPEFDGFLDQIDVRKRDMIELAKLRFPVGSLVTLDIGGKPCGPYTVVEVKPWIGQAGVPVLKLEHKKSKKLRAEAITYINFIQERSGD